MISSTMIFKKNWLPAQVGCAQGAHLFIAMSFLIAFGLLPRGGLAQVSAPAAANTSAQPAATGDGAISINEWLSRMHEAAMKKRSYIGTLVQTSQSGISSARIWHTCDGSSQIERMETLTGAPRSSIRRDDKLVTFMPEIKLARFEKREGMGAGSPLTELLKPGAYQIPDFYTVKSLGSERIAGLEAEMVQLSPRDNLRYGYRLWTERKSALVLKLQTMDASGAVLEQAAFSELQLDAPVKADKLKQMMKPADGWRIEQTELIKTTAAAEGWQLKAAVPGFKAVSCHKRGVSSTVSASAAGAPTGNETLAGSAQASMPPTMPPTMQWVFSDGLATVSLFVETYDKNRHAQEGMAASGATHSLFRRMNDYFLTAVGEVPPQTLRQFAAALERKK
jgi:sigma-E factor negative regulatory protein RseB